ncbi:hypothetical protein [Simkania negevensis]|uniref:Uncharacterized protein n=1 Tax=Simkania negevensis (strain ATCC VR-1471 / DSM 27360 / Z) TaxID=331113 RepID=F8L5W7_SIMNZ|nr:hypothetical protein [Simkania negevensis]CCB88109.1 hypothetical protein SNE_A02320 [Simkania negevensis Z]
MSPFKERENTFVLLSDILKCFARNWGKIALITAVFFSLGFWVALNQKVRFKVLGRFKEAHADQVSTRAWFVQNLLSQVGVSAASQSCHLLKSFQLMATVVEDLGLQASVITETPWKKRLCTMRENWNAERKVLLEDPDIFVFRNVKYDKNVKKKYRLVFQSLSEFEIFHPSIKSALVKGELGVPISFDNITLTIEKVPQNLKLHHLYPLEIEAKMSILGALSDQLEVEMNLKDATIYELCLPYRDRELGIKIVNELMVTYQRHLRNEASQMSGEQIAYLEKRKDELCGKMDGYLKDHVSYLKENLGMQGFLNLSQRLHHVSMRKQKFLDEKKALDSDLIRLGDFERETELAMSGEIRALQNEKNGLLKQRDSLNLGFAFRKNQKMKRLHPPYAPQEDVFFNVQDKLSKLDTETEKIALAEKGETGVLKSLFPSLMTTRSEISDARLKEKFHLSAINKVDSIAASELKKIRLLKSSLEEELMSSNQLMEGIEPEDYASYLKQQHRLVSLQEHILKERLFYPLEEQDTYKGIDLATARTLYRDYVNERDEQEAKVLKLQFSKEHMDDPDFEYISLVQILPDGVSQQLARSVGETAQTMRDTRHLTERDLERMERRLQKDQENLKRHIDQTIELIRLQTALTEERLTSVQLIILDLLNQEISLLDQQIEDQVKVQKKTLEFEKTLVQNELQKLENELSMVPDQWLKEHQLELSSEMNLSMLESMVKMVESKNVEHNLIQIQSKPIDPAYALLTPKPPHLKLFALVGTLIGFLIGCSWALILDFSKGFPLTLKNLKLQGRLVCGAFKRRRVYQHLDEVTDSSLQVLRNLAEALRIHQKGCVFSLLSGNGSNYARPLAELLGKEEKNVLLIDFQSFSKNTPGLFAYLKGEEKNVMVKKNGGVDVVLFGSNETASLELLKRPLFQKFLTEKKNQYDVVVLQSATLPGTAEGRFFMTISDCLAVTIDAESNEHLNPYYAWEAEGKTLAFVAN